MHLATLLYVENGSGASTGARRVVSARGRGRGLGRVGRRFLCGAHNRLAPECGNVCTRDPRVCDLHFSCPPHTRYSTPVRSPRLTAQSSPLAVYPACFMRRSRQAGTLLLLLLNLRRQTPATRSVPQCCARCWCYRGRSLGPDVSCRVPSRVRFRYPLRSEMPGSLGCNCSQRHDCGYRARAHHAYRR